jgi:hypothetical protein
MRVYGEASIWRCTEVRLQEVHRGIRSLTDITDAIANMLVRTDHQIGREEILLTD